MSMLSGMRDEAVENFDAIVLGGGNGGMYLAWHLAESGLRVAVIERRWIGGSCPNINCLPSKNEIFSANVADLAAPRRDVRRGWRFRPGRHGQGQGT